MPPRHRSSASVALCRRFRHGFHPVAQGFLVGMGRVSGLLVNGGLGRDPAFHDGPARGAFGLVSHKEQVVFWDIQAVLQVVDNAAARAHAGFGNDDGRAFEMQQALVVLELFHGIQVFEPDGLVPRGFQGFGFPVPAVVHILVKPGNLDARRGINEHRHPGIDAVQLIDQVRVSRQVAVFKAVPETDPVQPAPKNPLRLQNPQMALEILKGLDLQHLWIVYSGNHIVPLEKRITLVPLDKIKAIQAV